MNPNLGNALWITLIGMGLVFIALLLLWGLMALMVNLTSKMADREALEVAGESGEEAAREPEPVSDASRRKAAAVAVAVALQIQAKATGSHVCLPAPESFSAWQSVMRSNRLTQKSRTYSRKQ